MGIKKIFQEGLREFKRRTSLLKEKRELHQKEKLYTQQLTILGKKAWESKIDITSFNNLKELISGNQQQLEEEQKRQENLEKQREETEETRKQKNESFDARRKELEEQKREIDFQLDKEKKILKDAQRESNDATNRLNQIPKEEEALKKKNEDEETSNIEREQNRRKLDAFVLEKEQLQKKIEESEKTIKETGEKIIPIEEESEKFQKLIDETKTEQREVIGDLDKVLSEIREKINNSNTQLKKLNEEQEEYFEQLGRNLSDSGTDQEEIHSELSEVKGTEKDMAEIKTRIEDLDQAETASSRSAFWKMIWFVAACVVIIIAVIISLTLLFGSNGNDNDTPASSISQKKESKTIPPQVAETLEKYQQKIDEADKKKKQDSSDKPMSMSETMEQMDDATGELKKQSEKLQGKKIVTSDKDALSAALPKISDWEMTEPSYNIGKFGQLENSTLRVTYKDPESKEVDVTITDTATASAILHSWQVIFQMNITREDDDGYQKIVKVNDIPVIERYNKNTNRSLLAFIYKNRYIVEVGSTDVDSIKILEQFAGQMGLSNLD